MENYQNNSPQYIIETSTVSRLMQRVFLWMGLGLGITALSAWLTLSTNLIYTIADSKIFYWGLIIAELGLVWVISSRVWSLGSTVATALFGLYSVLNGMTLSFIFLVYTGESLISTFLITAATFGATALFGYLTKRDLSSMGSILMMALIGIVIASLVNVFIGSSMLTLVISIIGVLLFVGLTAYDTYVLKQVLQQVEGENDEIVKQLSLLGALNLYLDFINLFLFLLRLLGSRRS